MLLLLLTCVIDAAQATTTALTLSQTARPWATRALVPTRRLPPPLPLALASFKQRSLLGTVICQPGERMDAYGSVDSFGSSVLAVPKWFG